MDQDDVALPTRLAKQVAFLSDRPDVAILGTAYWLIDQKGRHVDLKRFPTSDLHIRWTNLLAPAFAHPTVMLRRDLLLENGLWYDSAFPDVEDYDLWRRVLRHSRGANLGEALLDYRCHPGSMSSLRRATQLQSSDLLALQTVREELPDFPVSLESVSPMMSSRLRIALRWETPISTCSTHGSASITTIPRQQPSGDRNLHE
jgi:hypothetical protein